MKAPTVGIRPKVDHLKVIVLQFLTLLIEYQYQKVRVELKQIKTEIDYLNALKKLEENFDVNPGTQESDELEIPMKTNIIRLTHHTR